MNQGHAMIIRDAGPAETPFLARCILAGMHFSDFEPELSPENEAILHRLAECVRREDMLYSYRHFRIAEVGGKLAGALLSYPGDIYREGRRRTFEALSPDLVEMERLSEQEADPGEYYLDTLAVLPEYRHRGLGRALLEDGIRQGAGLGYDRITLVADAEMPSLVRYYESLGFRKADRRRAFDTDFQRMVYAGDSSMSRQVLP